mmetsp:Transcript_41969/g.115796  ORF Transcript_41969/g.115796 Transcript_41969/m.115796 type:complete len:398 (+) Transcript_41969:56-1249(+)
MAPQRRLLHLVSAPAFGETFDCCRPWRVCVRSLRHLVVVFVVLAATGFAGGTGNGVPFTCNPCGLVAFVGREQVARRLGNSVGRRGRRLGRQCGGGLRDAYRVLGLEVGADLAAVKSAFRSRARESHPDVCEPSDLPAARVRFVALKGAYDAIVTGAADASAASEMPQNLGRNMAGFSQNMAIGRGHHKITDGRLYELWLDLRRGGAAALDNSRMESMALFFRLRAIVDGLGRSLLQEGGVAGVLADDPSTLGGDAVAGPGSSTSRERLSRVVDNWDHGWLPLYLASACESNGDHLVRNARTGAIEGCLREAGGGLGLLSGPGGSAEVSDRERIDLVVAAANGEQAELAKSRYSFVMRSLALPPDAVAWAVAATAFTSPEEAAAAAAQVLGAKGGVR